VQRARLRSLNAGFAGIVLAVIALASVAGASPDTGFELAVEGIVLLSIPLLAAAFSPPGWLRGVWREHEEAQFRHAVNNLLLYSPDAATLARRALEWASRLLGGGAALIALDGQVVAIEGLDDSAARTLHAELEGVRTIGGRSFTSSLGPTAVVPLDSRAGGGYLAVVAGPFTPLFGDEELLRLDQYGVSVTVALDRVHLDEGVRRNAELLDLAYDAVFSWSFATRGIQYWNKAAAQLYGYGADEVLGRDLQALLHSQYPIPMVDILADLCARDHWEGEVVQQTKDGRAIPISARWALQRDARGEPLSVVEVNRDISVEKRAADELRRARDVAEQASIAKSEYLSRMSHELRTPLAAMIGFSDLLEIRGPREDQLLAIEAIQKAGSHLLSLVNDVLDIARIESGRETLSLQPVDVRAVVEESVNLVSRSAHQRGMTIDVRVDDMETVYVRADRQRLIQVLLNLLSNAVKYGSPEGHVVVGASVTEHVVEIHVADDGPGLDEDEQERLFQPFERLGAERSNIEGTGLGLALCRQLSVAMGGSVRVESTKGEGATFIVHLERATSTDVSSIVPAIGPAVLRDRVTDHTVLYVEDNLATVALVESIFALRPNLRLLTAMQGSLALDLAREHRPDLIILDLHLPDLDGDEVIHRLQDDSRTAEIPVVMYSADATDRQVERLLAAGAVAYLSKPARVGEFLALVDRILGLAAGVETAG
jgi:PAS domain S-box-containing protein